MAPGFDSNATSNDDNTIVELADGTTTGASKPRQKIDSEFKAYVLQPDRSGSGSMGALDATVAANTTGLATVNFNITGTWVGTVRAEGTLDGGATWLLLVSVGSGQSIFATSTTNDIFKVQCGGYSQVRMRMSAYTSGSATVVWDAGIGLGPVQVWNTNSVSLKTEAFLNDAAGADVILGQKTMANSLPVVIASDQYQLISAINGNIGVEGAVTVGTSAVEAKVGGATLANRSSLTVWNNSLVNIFWGYTSGVTTSSGTPIPPSKPATWDVGANQKVYLIAGTASNNTRVTEA